jgi:hypothetical protein
VEHGKAPQEVVARRRPPALESRPLCPFPSYAKYVGGDGKQATAFQCQQPQG